MNKKNIIIFSIAAALFANYAVGMEKKTDEQKDTSIHYHTTDTKARFYDSSYSLLSDSDLSNLLKKSKNLKITFWHLCDGELPKYINSFFEKAKTYEYKIISLNIIHTKEQNEHSSKINWAPRIESLTVGSTMLSAKQLNDVLHQLKHLDLSGNGNMSFTDFVWKDAKKLKTLNLSYTGVTTKIVNKILEVTKLESITLIGCENVNPEEIINTNKVKIILN